MAAGAIMGLIAEDEERDLQRDLEKEIKNRPKYGSANRNLAKARAMGRSKEAQIADQQIEQDAENAAFQASNITGSTSSLLSTIAAINAGTQSNRLNLAAQESQMGDQRMQAYFDEYDKEFEQDVNMPHQLRIARLREQIKHQQNKQLAGASYEAQTTSSFLGSMGGGMMGSSGGANGGNTSLGYYSTDKNYNYDPYASIFQSRVA